MDERLSMIFARRSIREYAERAVGDSEVKSLLEAAMAAPSANDRQPWRFVVVRNRPTLKKLADMHPYAKMLSSAALAVAVCGDPAISDWWTQDCFAATENLLIAAAGLGLGAVWIGCLGRPERERAVRICLEIPETIGVASLISVGYPAEKKAARTQYDDRKIHADRW